MNRRRILAAMGGWHNPYVTDGLVAMWDGEWNAGGGVHDHQAEEWIDLVHGITPTHLHPFSWGDDYAMIDRSHSMFWFYNEELLDAIRDGGFYVELVMRNMTGYNGNGAILVNRDGDAHRNFEIFTGQDGNYFTWTRGSFGGAGYGSLGKLTKITTFCNLETKKLEIDVLFDNVHHYLTVNKNTASFAHGAPFCVGTWTIRSTSNPATSYYCTDLRIKSLRLYSRRPNLVGMQQNQTVDMKRFGIG